jgi:hypothetical protein
MDPTPPLPALPYGTISPEFENLLVATVNKVDREWPAKWQAYPGAAYIVESVARITHNTHLSIRYLCAQEPPRPERKVEFALSAIPIVRSLLVFCPMNILTIWRPGIRLPLRERRESHAQRSPAAPAHPLA